MCLLDHKDVKYFVSFKNVTHQIIMTNGDSLPECPPHRLIVHVWLVLVLAPQLGHGLRVNQLEDALLPLGPLYVSGTGVFVLEEVQQELPKVGGAPCWKSKIINICTVHLCLCSAAGLLCKNAPQLFLK